MRKPGPLLDVALIGCLLMLPGPGRAGVTTDGSLGPVLSLSGQMTIAQDLGTAVGGNLFHSFADFSVQTGESATFVAIEPFDNVISRVTGGAPSLIDGPLASSIRDSAGLGADFWFINPAGLVFGPNATLEVVGALHAGTADYLRLGDCGAVSAACGEFQATNPGASTLTAAAPERFGFLSANAGDIQVNGAELFVPLGTALSLVGGDISAADAVLSAQTGRLNLVGVAGAGEFAPGSGESSVSTSGDVSLSNARLRADGLPDLTRAGRVFIRGGEIVAEASQITANHETAGAGGGISLVADEAISLSSGSLVQVVNSGAGDPGKISLTGGDIRLAGASLVDSQARSSGPGAPLEVNGTDIELVSGSRLQSSGFLSSAADIGVTAAGGISIDDGGSAGTTGIFSSVLIGPMDGAGSIALQAVGRISLRSGGLIFSQTSGAGSASSIDLTAHEILLDGTQAPSLLTGVISQNQSSAMGNSGNVMLHADEITILGNSEVASNTLSPGAGGTVGVTADTLLIDGTAGVNEKFTGISSGAFGTATGNAGAVVVTSDVITLLARGAIASDTAAAGNAGSVSVTSSQLLIDGRDAFEAFAGISSDSRAGASGNAGAVSVQSDSITILGGGHISNTASGAGSGTSGGVAVNAGSILVDGTGVPPGYTDIATRTLPGASANAGDINVQADELTLRGGGEISSSTFNSGNGGRVEVRANAIRIDGTGAPAGLTGMYSGSNQGVTGSAGAVTVRSDQLEILAGGAIGTNTDGQGDAGDIAITGTAGPAAQVVVTGAGSAVTSLSSGVGSDAGAAGRVSIEADSLAVTDGALIAASTVDGVGGRIELNVDLLSLVAGSGISTTTTGTGQAGDISITGLPCGDDCTARAASVRMSDGSRISAASSNAAVVSAEPGQTAQSLRLGNAGSIFLTTNDLYLDGGSSIQTLATTSAGGDIGIEIFGDIFITRSSITASAQGLQGVDSGGNVTITKPQFLILDGGEIRADANAGRGGNILLDATGFIASADSIISASSAQSVDGEVTNTSENTVAGLAAVASPNVVPVEPVRTHCDAERLQSRSSLVVRRTRSDAVLAASDPCKSSLQPTLTKN